MRFNFRDNNDACVLIFTANWLSAALACVAGARLEVVGERENGRARARHAHYLRSLFPSACYAGYSRTHLGKRDDLKLFDSIMTVKTLVGRKYYPSRRRFAKTRYIRFLPKLS